MDTRYNEDQATCVLGEIIIPPTSQINNNVNKAYCAENKRHLTRPTSVRYLYIGMFDGHGGPGAAIKASKELHQIVHEGLDDVVEYLEPYEDCDSNHSQSTQISELNGK